MLCVIQKLCTLWGGYAESVRARTGVGWWWWGVGGSCLKRVRFPISGMKMLILSFVQKHHTPPPPLGDWLGHWRVLNTWKFRPRSFDVIARCHACIFRTPCPKPMIFPFLKVGTYALRGGGGGVVNLGVILSGWSPVEIITTSHLWMLLACSIQVLIYYSLHK